MAVLVVLVVVVAASVHQLLLLLMVVGMVLLVVLLVRIMLWVALVHSTSTAVHVGTVAVVQAVLHRGLGWQALLEILAMTVGLSVTLLLLEAVVRTAIHLRLRRVESRRRIRSEGHKLMGVRRETRRTSA